MCRPKELLAGPRGYRVNVIDFDTSTRTPLRACHTEAGRERPVQGSRSRSGRMPTASSAKRPPGYDKRLLSDPKFHAQNVYAIVMRTLARFEFALGRRVPWGSEGHQIHIAPHAFADANAFYSREDRAIFFGYFMGPSEPADLHMPLARYRRPRDHARDTRWVTLAVSGAVIARSGRLPRRLRRCRRVAVDILAARSCRPIAGPQQPPQPR